jgi:Ca2+-transporting ATPase
MLMSVYDKKVDDVLKQFASSSDGLTSKQASVRLKHYGKNIIKLKDEPLFRKIIAPFQNIFILVLVVAALVSLYQGEKLEAMIIIILVLTNAVIDYIQSFSTARILKALKKYESQQVKTSRDGQIVLINREDLIPGDIIYLGEGDKIPADARIIQSENLRCDESMLTGESNPIDKQSRSINSKKEIYEQSNILFQGTFVVSGSSKAMVFATGNETESGNLAKLTEVVQPTSPVQKKINRLISKIVIIISVAVVAAFILCQIRGINLTESIRFVLSFAVSAVPEGLPVAVSVVLALGMRRMAKKNALVRNMAAIENIGVVTLIATDKTGTLTKNQLRVRDVWQLKDNSLKSTCQIINLSINSKDNVIYDPLDVALLDFSRNYKVDLANLKLYKTLPFEIAHSMSGNVWKDNNDKYQLYLKGAPEKVIEKCDLSRKDLETIHQSVIDLTSKAYRVVALAYNQNLTSSIDNFKDLPPNSLQFEALIAIADELRPESKATIKTAMKAGVKVCMITGDHFETAYAIGKELGLIEARNQVFDTRRMDGMTDAELEAVIKVARVYSRVVPENKRRLLDLFEKNEITAMTGDGVNDVPALTNANIGIAMGSGSEIAKESSDIVLLDNNFKSIVSALKEGRQIYDNIRRMLFYLLSTNLGEVMITLVALIIGLPLPLLSVQILWINLVTDSCMVIPLGLEPSSNDVMLRPPRRANKPIIGRRSVSRMLTLAVAMTVICLSVFTYFLQNHSLDYARTIAFMVIVVVQWANAFNARSEWRILFGHKRRFNPAFLVGILSAIALQSLAFLGPLQQVMHTVDISSKIDLVVSSVGSFVLIILVDEIFKLVYKQKSVNK